MSEDAKPVAVLCELDFNCPMQWEQLEKTEVESIRHCTSCKEDVTFCNTEEQVLQLAMRGECVAFSVPLTRPYERGQSVRRGLRHPKDGGDKLRSFTDTL